MTLNDLKMMLERNYPREFIAETVHGSHDEIRIRKRGGPDFADEDIVGFYNLEDPGITWEMIAEDAECFLTQKPTG